MKNTIDIRKISIEIGEDKDKTKYFYKPYEMPYLLICGKHGTGKTNLVKKIMNEIQKQMTSKIVKFAVFDSKGDQYVLLKESPYAFLYYCDDSTNYLELLKYARCLVDYREALLKELQEKSIEEHNKNKITKLEYVFLVVDDFSLLSEEAKKLVLYLCKKGKVFGVYIIIAISDTSITENRTLTGGVKACFLDRMCFKVDSRVESKLVADYYGAEMLNANELLISSPLVKKLIRIVKTQ